MSDFKFDIFAALTAADRNDKKWFSKLDEEMQKAFPSPIYMKWASALEKDGIEHEYALTIINEFVNKDAEILMKHPELMFMLSSMAGIGKKTKHAWIPFSKKDKRTKVEEALERLYPDANDFEIEILLRKHTKQTFKDFLEDSGFQDVEIKSILKDFKPKS